MIARRRNIALAVMVGLAALWLVAASRVHVNASWSDEAWGYAVVPLFGEDPGIGDRVLFDPPEAVGAKVPYLKTVRGVPGMTVAVGVDGKVSLDGMPVGRAKTRALDGIEPAVTHGLTMAYARADVEAPEALVERLIGQIGPLRESGRLRQAFEKQMGNAEAEA